MAELRALRKSAGGDISGRHKRAPWSLPLFATFVTFAFVLVLITPPDGGAAAYAVMAPERDAPAGVTAGVQSLDVAGEYSTGAGRDAFSISQEVKPAPAAIASGAPAAGTPDPGSAQAIAYEMLVARGWGDDQFNCLVALWSRESGWNTYAHNARSGAYGIPQALPGSKMASAGEDWATNPATQISWGLGYISGRYGTPCGAWEHSEIKGWY